MSKQQKGAKKSAAEESGGSRKVHRALAGVLVLVLAVAYVATVGINRISTEAERAEEAMQKLEEMKGKVQGMKESLIVADNFSMTISDDDVDVRVYCTEEGGLDKERYGERYTLRFVSEDIDAWAARDCGVPRSL